MARWKAAALAMILAGTANAQVYDSASRSGIRPQATLEKPPMMRKVQSDDTTPQAPTHMMLGSFGEIESRFTMTNVSEDPVYVKIQLRESEQFIDGTLAPGQLIWVEDLNYDLNFRGERLQPVDLYIEEPDKVIFESKLIKYSRTTPFGTAGMTTSVFNASESIGTSQMFGFQLPRGGNGKMFLQSFPGEDAAIELRATRPDHATHLTDISIPAGTAIEVSLPQAENATGIGFNDGGSIHGFGAIENGAGDLYGSKLVTHYEPGAVIPGVKNRVPIHQGNHAYPVDLTTVISLARVTQGDAGVTLTSHLDDASTRSTRVTVPAQGLYIDDGLLAKLGVTPGRTAAVTVDCDDGAQCAIINAHTEVRTIQKPAGKARAVRKPGEAFTRAEENPILSLDDHIDPSRKSIIGNVGVWQGAETIVGIYAVEQTRADIEIYWENGDYLGKAQVDVPAGAYREFNIGNTICLPEFAYGRVEIKPLTGKAYVSSWRNDKGSRDSWTSKGAIRPNDGPTGKKAVSGWDCTF